MQRNLLFSAVTDFNREQRNIFGKDGYSDWLSTLVPKHITNGSTPLDEKNWTLLMHAVRFCNLDSVRWILKTIPYVGADRQAHVMSLQSSEADGAHFALQLAIQNLHDEEKSSSTHRGEAVGILKELLKAIGKKSNKIDINMKDARGKTAFMELASLPGDNAMLMELMLAITHEDKSKPLVDMAYRDKQGLSAFGHAIRAGNIRIVSKLLEHNSEFVFDYFQDINELHKTKPVVAKEILEQVISRLVMRPISTEYNLENSFRADLDVHPFSSALIEAVRAGNVKLYQIYIEVCLGSYRDAYHRDTISTGNFPLIPLLQKTENLVIAADLLKWLLDDEYRTPCKPRLYDYRKYLHDATKFAAHLVTLHKHAVTVNNQQVSAFIEKLVDQNIDPAIFKYRDQLKVNRQNSELKTSASTRASSVSVTQFSVVGSVSLVPTQNPVTTSHSDSSPSQDAYVAFR